MSDLKISRLAPEVLIGNQVWLDFIDSMDEVFVSKIDGFIRVLEFLRFLEYDPELKDVFYNTARMLGFDLTQDFMQLNADALAKLAVQLSRFGETSGTDKFTDFIGFILGRTLAVRPLYTNNYVDFYIQPAGTLNIDSDSGTWYKTTHVELEVNLQGLNGKILVSPSGSLLDRVMSVFYEYCPINLVVKNVYFTIDLYKDVCVCGGLNVFPRDYSHAFPVTAIDTLEILGPDEIDEFAVARYSVRVTWDNGTVTEGRAHVWSTDMDSLTLDHDGLVRAPLVSASTPATITATYMDETATKTVTINDTGLDRVLQSFEIIGPDEIDENIAFGDDGIPQYLAQGTWTDGTTGPVTVDGWQLAATTIAIINTVDGRVSTGQVGLDTYIEVQASVTIQTQEVMSATKTVLVRNKANVVDRIRIVGPTSVQESHQVDYYVEVTYVDGSSRREYDPIWRLYTDKAAFHPSVPGRLIVYSLDSNTTARLDAIYSEGQVSAKASTIISLLNEESSLTLLDISGPSTVQEKAAVRYTLVAHWSNGTRTTVNPIWETSYFQIDQNGVLRTGIVDGSATVTLTAKFVMGDTLDDIEVRTKDVTVLKNSIIPQELSIECVSQLNVGSFLPVRAYLVWSDKSTTDVTASINTTWEVNNSRAFMDNFELSVSDDFTTFAESFHVVSRYTHTYPGGAQSTFEAIKLVYVSNIKPSSKKVKSLAFVDFPPSIEEYEVVELAAMATYDDDTQAIVAARWRSDNVDINVEEEICEVDHTGRLYARSIEQATSVWITATFMGAEVKQQLNVTSLAYPAPKVQHLRISGPASVQCDSQSYYDLWVKWEACGQETPVSPQWELHEVGSNITSDPIYLSDTVASIDCSGVLRTKTIRQSFILVARYECASGGQYVRHMNVELQCDYGALIALNIVGPSRVPHANQTLFYLEAEYTGSTITHMQVDSWAIELSIPQSVAVISQFHDALTDKYYGKVNVATLMSDIPADIVATWTDPVHNQQHTIRRTVTLATADVPTALLVEGPDTITEANTANYIALVTYGQSRIDDVTADSNTLWVSSNTSVATFTAKGSVQAQTVTQDEQVLLTCQYQYQIPGISEPQRIEGTKAITVVDQASAVVYLEIECDAVLPESSSIQLTVNIVDSVGVKTPTVADSWTLLNAGGVAAVDNQGLLTTSDIDSDSVITITAVATHEQNQLTASKQVTIQDIARPVSLTISGPAQVLENDTYTYTATVLDDKGATTNKTSESTWSVDHASASIADGILTVGDVATDTAIVLSASYDDGVGGVVSNSLSVTVQNVDLVPRWGFGVAGLDSDADIINLANVMTTNFASGPTDVGVHDVIVAATGQYLYYALPRALVTNWSRNAGASDSGIAFYNLDATGTYIGTEGSMDGAHWDGDQGTSNPGTYTHGALEVPVTLNQQTDVWLLYRSDFPISAGQGFRVSIT